MTVPLLIALGNVEPLLAVALSHLRIAWISANGIRE